MKISQKNLNIIINKNQFNTFFSIILFITISIIPIKNSQISKLILTKTQQNQYVLQTIIGKKQIDMNAYLQNQSDWIIQDQCTICQDQNDKQFKNCKDQCYNQKIQGIQCNKSYCKKHKQQQKQNLKNLPSFILHSNQVILKIKQKQTLTKLNYTTSLVTKSSKKVQQIGHINLLNGKYGYFNNQVIIVKNNNKDITVYYSQNKDQEDSNKNKMYENIDVIQKLDDIKNKQGIILQGQINTKQQNTQQNNSQDVQNQQQQDKNTQSKKSQKITNINQFSIKKIKLKQLYKQQSQKNLKQQQQTPSNSQLQLQFKKPKKLKFSLQTNYLLLPSSTYKKFTTLIIKHFFSIKSDVNNKQDSSSCKFEENVLKCTDKNQLKINKLDNVTLIFFVNQIEISIPIRALVISCSEQSCTFAIGINSNKKQVIFGDFIFNIFAVQFNYKDNKATFYRLNNQWARDYLNDRKYAQHQVNFLWMMYLLAFHAILWLLKIIAILALIILGLNCLYHWKQVFYWFMEIFSKISKKKLDLKGENFNTVGNKLNKMSIRIKDRLKQKFNRKKIFYQISQNSSLNLDEQITDHTQLKQENDKLVNVDELSEHGSSIDDEQQHKHHILNGRQVFNKQKIQDILQKQKQELINKMATKGQMPTIIKSGVISTKPIVKITSEMNQKIINVQAQLPEQKMKQLLSQLQQKTSNKQPQLKLQNIKEQDIKQQFFQFENNQLQFTDF